MPASDGKSEAEGPPQPRWYHSRWLGIAAAVLMLVLMLLGGYLYQRSRSPTVPPPPAVELKGVDPAVVKAVEQARSRVEESPRSAEGWGKLGMVLLVHQFEPQAAACFEQAERLDPRDRRWPYYQALEALLRSDLPAARVKLERAVALSDDQFDGPRLTLADVLLGLEEFDEAQRQFSHLLGNNPQHTRAQLGLARIAVKQGNLRASLEALNLIQSSPFTRKAACELLAEVQQRLDDPALAEAFRRRSAELPADRIRPVPIGS